MQELNQQNFDAYLKSACFSLIGFCNPSDAKGKELKAFLEELKVKYFAMQFGIVDTTKNLFVSKFGLNASSPAILVIFTSDLKPRRAITNFGSEQEIIKILFEEGLVGKGCSELSCDQNAR